jgi:drug/metabolite transporter (DMT)-like permease
MPAPRPAAAVRPVDLVLLVLLGAIWGAVFLFNRIAAPEVGAAWAAAIRIGVAALVLLALFGRETVAAARGRWHRFAIVGATFSAIPFTLLSFAALTLPASLGAVLNAATPMFTAVIGAIWLGQAIGPRVVAGLALGTLAVLVSVGWSPLEPGPATIVAAFAALGAAMSYGVAGTYVRRSLPGVRPIHLATAQLTFGALFVLPFAILSGPPAMPSLAGAASLLALALPATALAWPLFLSVLGRTTPTAASTVTFIVPVFGMLWAAIGLGEPIGPELIVGFGLIVVSLVLILRIPLPRRIAAGDSLPRRTLRALRAPEPSPAPLP